MKFSGILVATLLQYPAYAATDQNVEMNQKRPRRLTKKRNQQQRKSETVRYFTVGSKANVQSARKHKSKRNHHTKIVGGDESNPGEFPYYGKKNRQLELFLQ